MITLPRFWGVVMAELIETLSKQHREVLALVEELDAALVANRSEAVAATLRRVKVALSAHLALEDAELYPGLIALARDRNEPHLLSIAKSFATNMERISEALIAFLKRYENPPADLGAFRRDWSAIATVLGSRIQAEESSLYPLYARTQRKAAAEASERKPTGSATGSG